MQCLRIIKYSLICFTFTGTLNQLHFILFIHHSSNFIFQFLHLVSIEYACLLGRVMGTVGITQGFGHWLRSIGRMNIDCKCDDHNVVWNLNSRWNGLGCKHIVQGRARLFWPVLTSDFNVNEGVYTSRIMTLCISNQLAEMILREVETVESSLPRCSY